MVRSTVLAVASAAIVGQAVHAHYTLDSLYDASNFFQEFTHFNQPDPTQGFVEYVDQPTAQAAGLSGIRNGSIYMGVDSTTKDPPKGRRSVRLESTKTFTRGLVIADIAHMPTNKCGVWPAFWTFGPDWPSSGEIDIIEGVNTQTEDSVTLHTENECRMSSFGGLTDTVVVSDQCNSANGCGQQTSDNQNYGDGFNAIGGGVYAMEWTDRRISVWFFPRSDIPDDITDGIKPEPLLWGFPIATFIEGFSCDIDEAFRDHKIVFDTTFCGSWAGRVWPENKECAALAPTCKDYVSANPQEFADAFWSVNSVKVYKKHFLDDQDFSFSQTTTVAQDAPSVGSTPGYVPAAPFLGGAHLSHTAPFAEDIPLTEESLLGQSARPGPARPGPARPAAAAAPAAQGAHLGHTTPFDNGVPLTEDAFPP